MPDVTTTELTQIADARGSLLVGEAPRQIPFVPVRFFLITGAPVGVARGGHAHRACHQYLVAISGSVAVEWETADDEGRVVLDRPTLGLHVPPLTWASEHYLSEDAALLVFASELYDRAEYIESSEEFAQLARS